MPQSSAEDLLTALEQIFVTINDLEPRQEYHFNMVAEAMTNFVVEVTTNTSNKPDGAYTFKLPGLQGIDMRIVKPSAALQLDEVTREELKSARNQVGFMTLVERLHSIAESKLPSNKRKHQPNMDNATMKQDDESDAKRTRFAKDVANIQNIPVEIERSNDQVPSRLPVLVKRGATPNTAPEPPDAITKKAVSGLPGVATLLAKNYGVGLVSNESPAGDEETPPSITPSELANTVMSAEEEGLGAKNVSNDQEKQEDAGDEDSPSITFSNIDRILKCWRSTTPKTFYRVRKMSIDWLEDLRKKGPHEGQSIQFDEASDLIARVRLVRNQLKDDVAKIPEEDWIIYDKKLSMFCETLLLNEMNLEQRLLKLTNDFYFNEELQAFKNGDWERLKAAIRLCATFAEITGALENEVESEFAALWVNKKMHSICWVKCLFDIARRNEAITDCVAERHLAKVTE